jgi:putative nucleotidyltransferase with HDIG domain
MEASIEEIKKLFPELEKVKNGEWVQKTCEIWKTAIEKSKWEKIEDAKFGDYENPEISLVAHTRAVIRYALYCADIINDFHGYEVKIDFDVLIITCILHDVSKMLEYEPDPDGKPCRISETGRTYQHGFYGAHYAEAAGFPPSVTTAIINHTSFSRVMPSTIESVILFFADQVDAELHKFLHGKSSVILKAVGKIGK